MHLLCNSVCLTLLRSCRCKPAERLEQQSTCRPPVQQRLGESLVARTKVNTRTTGQTKSQSPHHAPTAPPHRPHPCQHAAVCASATHSNGACAAQPVDRRQWASATRFTQQPLHTHPQDGWPGAVVALEDALLHPIPCKITSKGAKRLGTGTSEAVDGLRIVADCSHKASSLLQEHD